MLACRNCHTYEVYLPYLRSVTAILTLRIYRYLPFQDLRATEPI